MNPLQNPADSALSWDLVAIITLLCLIGSGIFSGCETGLMSTSRVRLAHVQRRYPDRGREILLKMLRHLEDPILTCLIGTNLCNVLASAVLTAALTARYGVRGEILTMLLMSVLIITFGEILPKVLYREYPERLTVASVGWIRFSMVILAPIRWLLRGVSLFWRRVLPSPGQESSSTLDRQSVSALLLTYSRPGDMDLQFRQAMLKFLELAQMKLSQIMQPVARIVTVGTEVTVADCLKTAARSGFSRLPQTMGNQITGWILVRDLILLQEPDLLDRPVPPALVRTPLLVDETMSPLELFEELHAQGQQIAFVVNRHGLSMGMVTLEDLLEMVVGSIQDEFDTPVMANSRE